MGKVGFTFCKGQAVTSLQILYTSAPLKTSLTFGVFATHRRLVSIAARALSPVIFFVSFKGIKIFKFHIKKLCSKNVGHMKTIHTQSFIFVYYLRLVYILRSESDKSGKSIGMPDLL